MATCPTCGQQVYPRTLGADELLAHLTANPDEYAYEGQDGGWYITKSSGIRTTRGAVDELASRGMLRRRYSDMDGAWWLGRTIDIPATSAARKAGRKTVIYLGDVP